MRSTLLTASLILSLTAFAAQAASLVDSSGKPILDSSGQCVGTEAGCAPLAKKAEYKPAKPVKHSKKSMKKAPAVTEPLK